MRLRSALVLPAAAAALFLAVPQAGAAATGSARPAVPKPAKCADRATVVRAHLAADPRLVHISVTNLSPRTCTVDRIPTVVFGDLDGAALPVPAGDSGPYPVGAGRTVYAAVRTIADVTDPEARRVDSISVSADPARFGRSFTARELGAGDAVLVWEPVTTWWQPSQAAADRQVS